MNIDKTIKWFLLSMWTLAMLAAGAGIGHRQMKRWQDSFYAAHPVVKEVSIVPTINGLSSIIVRPGQMCVFASFDKNLHFEASCEPDPDAPAPPKKAKPATRHKVGSTIPVCAQHYDDGKTEFARCQPAKANCSMPLNHGTATVYWPPREDGKCYPQDSPFQP